MQKNELHTFHIPVMGLGFTIDTPIKIARYGINSVVSIMEDELIESMRAFYAEAYQLPYVPILRYEENHRARRITAYLNLMGTIIDTQFQELKQQAFEKGTDICRYFELLPETSPLRRTYHEMMQMPEGESRIQVETFLRNNMKAGTADVNIMAKADRPGYTKDNTELPAEFSTALSSLRGYAESNLQSSLIISAGYNPRLFSYISNFKDFFPAEDGTIKKKIVLKVSDYRSAQIQGILLAKKGIWISEFRVESGLNCGGHAFPTEGLLTGPILEEFKEKRDVLHETLKTHCQMAWDQLGIPYDRFNYKILYSAQGGLGTCEEDRFFRSFYKLDYTGWGSPFLLVPECTNVDQDSLSKMCASKPADYYLSYASPLGVPFNNFHSSSASIEKEERIAANRPGAACYKHHLASNTEFTTTTICTASREYQHQKLKAILSSDIPEKDKENQMLKIVEKECLCEGLSTPALLKNKLPLPHKIKAVSLCPGPNLAYFSKVASLEEMCGHIYGRNNLISRPRPHVFINELLLYIDYYNKHNDDLPKTKQELKYLDNFKNNLLKGVEYYRNLFLSLQNQTFCTLETLLLQLKEFEEQLRKEETLMIG